MRPQQFGAAVVAVIIISIALALRMTSPPASPTALLEKKTIALRSQHALHRQAMHQQGDGTLQSLANMMKPSDFPYAIEQSSHNDAQKNSLARLSAIAEQLAAPRPSLDTSTLAAAGGDRTDEIKAKDSPIGLAEAARILTVADTLDKSKSSPAISQWKDAVKGAGPQIMEDIADDVTSFNPFPKQSLSEKMEIEDVWKKAQAMAKPAGSLDGTADDNKKTIENAGEQANAAAYLAANEAAAVDSYDVSMPNPDAMAHGTKPALQGQARAASQHHTAAMGGRAQAVPQRPHGLYMPRVQALAQLVGRDALDHIEEGIEKRALRDAKMQRGREVMLEKRLWETRGAEKEALALASDAQADMDFSSEQGMPHTLKARAAKPAASSGAKSIASKARSQYEQSLRTEARLERELKAAEQQANGAHAHTVRTHKQMIKTVHNTRAAQLERDASKLQAKLASAEKDLVGMKLEASEAAAEGEVSEDDKEEKDDENDAEEKQSVFDETMPTDVRIKGVKNPLSDVISSVLGDERVGMDDIRNNKHGAVEPTPPSSQRHSQVTHIVKRQPLNQNAANGEATWNNGLNDGIDPLDFERVGTGW